MSSDPVKLLTSRAEFNALVEANPYVAIQATASWCGPCKAVTPLFKKHAETLAVENKYAFAKFDIDDVPDLSQELGISSIPAFFFFENGEKGKDMKGAVPPKLKTLVEEYAAKANADAPAAPAAAAEEPLKTNEDF